MILNGHVPDDILLLPDPVVAEPVFADIGEHAYQGLVGLKAQCIRSYHAVLDELKLIFAYPFPVFPEFTRDDLHCLQGGVRPDHGCDDEGGRVLHLPE